MTTVQIIRSPMGRIIAKLRTEPDGGQRLENADTGTIIARYKPGGPQGGRTVKGDNGSLIAYGNALSMVIGEMKLGLERIRHD